MPRPPQQTIGHFFRLRFETHECLLELAARLGVSQAEVIARAVALLAERERAARDEDR